ncbi:MAG: sensor histidine kinase [Haloplanus sp.]
MAGETDGAGGSDAVELRVDADGSERVVEVSVETVDGEGAVSERVAVFHDVTEREARQDRLERQVDRLERFASIITHDLRDPLNTAQAKVELAKRECNSERLDDLQAIHQRMADLVEDVLALAKRGQAIGETETVPLDGVVEAAWRTVDADGDATLTTGTLPTVRADPERLRTLVENLLGNAVSHAGPAAAVEVGALADDAGFFVADDGPGVPESEREAVFEYGHTTAADGTGFGLAIVAEIAEAHGWSVDVTDAETGGARFEVRGVTVADA